MGKIRTHRKRGVELAGSEFDPRVGTNAQLRTMSDKQLVSYIERVKRFNLRGNQYYIAGDKSIVSSAVVQAYQYQAKRQAQFRKRMLAGFEGFEYKDKGITVAAHEKQMADMRRKAELSNARRVYGTEGGVHLRLSKAQIAAIRFSNADEFRKRTRELKSQLDKQPKKKGGKTYLQRQYEKDLELVEQALDKAHVDVSGARRDILKMGQRQLIALVRTSDIFERLQNLYELSRMDYSKVTMEGGGSGKAEDSLRRFISTYARVS